MDMQTEPPSPHLAQSDFRCMDVASYSQPDAKNHYLLIPCLRYELTELPRKIIVLSASDMSSGAVL